MSTGHRMEGLTGAFSFCFAVIRRAQLKSARMRRDSALVQRNTVMHVPLLGAPGEAEATDGRVHRRQQRIHSDIPRQLRSHRVGRAAPHSALHVWKRGMMPAWATGSIREASRRWCRPLSLAAWPPVMRYICRALPRVARYEWQIAGRRPRHRGGMLRGIATCLKSAEGFLEKVLVLEQDLLDSAATL